MTFDAGLTVWTFLTFGCLLLLLSRFAFKPLRKLLEERESAIRESLVKAAQARKQAEDLLARNAETLEEARGEVRRIIGDGHKIVTEMKRESREAARRETDLVMKQAREEIDREFQKSIEELKTTVANLSIRVSRQVIREQLDEKRHAELAEAFIERLKQAHATRSGKS